MREAWYLAPNLEGGQEESLFSSLDAIFALDGQLVAKDPLSEVLRIEAGHHRFYVKRYSGNGKNLRRRWFGLRQWLARPRVRAEWQNLLSFAQWGIPTAELVAYGMERRWAGFRRGALVTREIPDTVDLAKLALTKDSRLRNAAWVAGVSSKVAKITRTMHQHGFVHNDLKWRNLLVSGADEPVVYLIDCPWGGLWWGPFLRYRIIKDLACLDKVAKYHLSRTQRLRFYLDYLQQPKLRAEDKQNLRKVLGFFEGRE